jgi:hypothetical protein
LDGDALMKVTVQLLLLTVIFGCAKSDPQFPGYKVGSGDVTPFFLASAISLGARPIKTNGLPALVADWRYKVDKDGFQIHFIGDRFAEVRSLLLEAFGAPAMVPSTNGDHRFAGVVYAGRSAGVAINLGNEDLPNGTRSTEVVVVKPGAL